MREYERLTGHGIDDEVKKAVVMSQCASDLQRHLDMNETQFGRSYAEMRRCVESFIRAQKHWSGEGEMQPMVVDAVTTSMGKGKSKGKEKGTGVKCYCCGGRGHIARQCSSREQQPSRPSAGPATTTGFVNPAGRLTHVHAPPTVATPWAMVGVSTATATLKSESLQSFITVARGPRRRPRARARRRC